jgi:hypothetical protein
MLTHDKSSHGLWPGELKIKAKTETDSMKNKLTFLIGFILRKYKGFV